MTDIAKILEGVVDVVGGISKVVDSVDVDKVREGISDIQNGDVAGGIAKIIEGVDIGLAQDGITQIIEGCNKIREGINTQ